MPSKSDKKEMLLMVLREIQTIAEEYIDSLDESDPMPSALDVTKLAIEVYEGYQKDGLV